MNDSFLTRNHQVFMFQNSFDSVGKTQVKDSGKRYKYLKFQIGPMHYVGNDEVVFTSVAATTTWYTISGICVLPICEHSISSQSLKM
jgi:hypothetical protein